MFRPITKRFVFVTNDVIHLIRRVWCFVSGRKPPMYRPVTTEFPFVTTGVIRYDPPRPGMKGGKFTNKGKGTADTKFRNEWWCVIELDEQIGWLYRWFLDRHWYEVDRSVVKRDMVKPGWPLHVSVVRGERPPRPDQWKYRDGERVEVHYAIDIRQTGDSTGYDRPDSFFFLEAKCDAVLDIRKHLGLKYQHNGVPFKSHITIARIKE